VSRSSKTTDNLLSPDQNASGLLATVPDALRYDCERVFDPHEVPGIVAEMIPAGSRVLDVGCGAGVLARMLADKCGAEFVGIEPDPARAARARERSLEVHLGSLTDEIVREIGSFDIVLFADVLEHLPNPQSVLLLSRSALKPRGAVIVSVPNVAHWSVRLSLLRGIFKYRESGIMDATHLRWFTGDSIRSLLTSSGFRVIQYRATASPGLPDNEYRAPLRWLPPNLKARFLEFGSKKWPTLFGAQHVLKAEME
jgi:methionine biosynthesis protein MetW